MTMLREEIFHSFIAIDMYKSLCSVNMKMLKNDKKKY